MYLGAHRQHSGAEPRARLDHAKRKSAQLGSSERSRAVYAGGRSISASKMTSIGGSQEVAHRKSSQEKVIQRKDSKSSTIALAAERSESNATEMRIDSE